MNCETGEHVYRPFKRSRDLFCVSCGALRLCEKQVLAHHATNPSSPSTAEYSQSLPDPARAAAESILENLTFERKIHQILNECGAIGPVRDKLEAEALSFGPTLDIEHFANYARENVDALPVQEPMENLFDEFGDR